MGLTGARLVMGLALIAILALLMTVQQISHMELSQRHVTLPVSDWTLHLGQSAHGGSARHRQHTPVGAAPQDGTPPNVCYYGDTRFFLSENSTAVFAKELVTFLGEVALRSFNDALTSGKIHVTIPVTEVQPHFVDWQDLVQFVTPMVESYDKLQVDFAPQAYTTIADSFHETNCDWVVSVKLDADDILAPGYLDWVVDKILPTVDRGAIVASRRLPRLNYGFNRCYANPKTGLVGKLGTHATCPYWAGWATGQTRIFRRDVFIALGMPFQSEPHALALSVLRSQIFTTILQETPPSYLEADFQIAKNYSWFNSTDAEMEAKTGIKMIETTDAGFGPAGIYMKTPLSSHFPFGNVSLFDRCSTDKWNEAVSNATTLNHVKGKYDYLYNWGQKSKITFYHMCKSSAMFHRERQHRGDFGRKPCEEMERKLQEELDLAAKSGADLSEEAEIAIMEPGLNMLSAENVCLYADIKIFFTKNATDTYIKEVLKMLRDVSLRSLNEALTDGRGKIQVHVPLPTSDAIFESRKSLRDFLRPGLRKYSNLVVDFSKIAARNLARTFKTTTCEWVVCVKLDADDVLSPNYLDWIIDSVIPTLDRGALVGSRHLPQLIYGFDRCYAKPTVMKGPHWGGYSVGQTRVFRRSVFEALDRPFQSDPPASVLTNFRSQVFSKILKKEPPMSLKYLRSANDFALLSKLDARLERETGIKMIETNDAGFGPAGMYVKSPLSSNFPFNHISNFLQCSAETWEQAISNATRLNTAKKGTYDYLYDWGQRSDMRLYDVCQSSHFFKLHKKQYFGTNDCSEMEDQFQEQL